MGESSSDSHGGCRTRWRVIGVRFSALHVERSAIISGATLLPVGILWMNHALLKVQSITVNTMILLLCFLSTMILMGLNGIFLIVVKLRAKNRLRFCGDR